MAYKSLRNKRHNMCGCWWQCGLTNTRCAANAGSKLANRSERILLFWCSKLPLILVFKVTPYICTTLTLTLTLYSSSTSYVEYQAGGGEGLVDLVNQLTLERCHSFLFYGSCRKRIPIRDSSMPKRILSQCGVSSKMFIGLIVPTTCSSVRWD